MLKQFITVVFAAIFGGFYAQQEKITCAAPAVNFELFNFCLSNAPTYFKNTTVSSVKAAYQWKVFRPGLAVPHYTSTETDISYQFPEIGTYTVELVATNPDGHTTTLIRQLKLDSALTADFDYQNCQGNFTNLSSCAESYYWDFGDSTYSTEKSPRHEYKFYGFVTAKLIARRGNRVDSVKKSFLAVPNNLNGKFSSHRLKDTVYFTSNDTILGGSNEYHWSWGDGTQDDYFGFSGMRPRHLYPKLGRDTTYTVMLLVRSMCYSAFSLSKVTIKDSTVVNGTFVYPNPMLDAQVLRILAERNEEITQVSVKDTKGHEMTQFGLDIRQNGIDLHLSALPPGLYFVSFKLGTEEKNYKIIKRQ